MRTYEDRYTIKEGFNSLPQNVYISKEIIKNTILHCYRTLDLIDQNLNDNANTYLSELVEKANLSSLVGNVLGSGYEKNCNGIYKRNKPNTFPDLLSNKDEYEDIEIKTSFNRNCPKGHLPKEGYYLIFRYDLTDDDGLKVLGEEKNWKTVTIWEIRFGYLRNNDFFISNTKYDSGKTATINISCLNTMTLLYFDPYICPYENSILKNRYKI